jgi:hypothetical protein
VTNESTTLLQEKKNYREGAKVIAIINKLCDK